MPDTITTSFNVVTNTASAPAELAEVLWRIGRNGHAAFNARAKETEHADPHWEGPEFAVLSEQIHQAENALMDTSSTTPLAILRKLELLFEEMNWQLLDTDANERRIVGGIITDLRRQIGHPADGTDDINVTRKWEPNHA